MALLSTGAPLRLAGSWPSLIQPLEPPGNTCQVRRTYCVLGLRLVKRGHGPRSSQAVEARCPGPPAPSVSGAWRATHRGPSQPGGPPPGVQGRAVPGRPKLCHTPWHREDGTPRILPLSPRQRRPAGPPTCIAGRGTFATTRPGPGGLHFWARSRLLVKIDTIRFIHSVPPCIQVALMKPLPGATT